MLTDYLRKGPIFYPGEEFTEEALEHTNSEKNLWIMKDGNM